MTRLLITGSSGFVGRHLVQHLQYAGGFEIHGVSRQPTSSQSVVVHEVQWDSLESISMVLKAVRPEQIIHLAGHADAGGSFANPMATWAGNLTTTLHLYESIRLAKLQPRILHISSGAVYGRTLNSDSPAVETSELMPISPYAASKAAGEMAAIQYGQHFPIIRVRPFNHIGTGQSTNFALANFAEQIAKIELGLAAPILETGNLDVERDIIDVRDMVQAYGRLLAKGNPGEVYNAGRGHPVTMQHCVETLLNKARVQIDLQIRSERKRALDFRRMSISVQKLNTTTGWTPTILLEESIEAILNDWRNRITTSSS